MRVDDYKNASLIALEELMSKEPNIVAQKAGAEYLAAEKVFKLDFFGRPALVHLLEKPDPTQIVKWQDQKEGEEFNLTDAVLVLHYLLGANGEAPCGELVAYRQIPSGQFYTQAFHKRAEIPLASVFGQNPGLLTKAVEKMGGENLSGFGDAAGKFRVLPHLDIVVQVYAGDEEFEASGSVLFDKIIGSYLHIEDVAWIGSALVYRLMGVARSLG